MSYSLRPHELQHTRFPCPSLSPRVCSNSCSLSHWCHLTISSSCPQPEPASGSFPKSWFFTSGSQSIGASASASVLTMNIQSWFPLGLTGCISLLSKELSMGAPQFESMNSLVLSLLYGPTLTCVMYTTTGKTKALTKRTFVGKVMFLLLILSAFVTAFLPRSKSLLILWLQSPSIVILEPKKIKSVRYYFTIKIVELYPVAYLSYMLKLSKTFK